MFLKVDIASQEGNTNRWNDSLRLDFFAFALFRLASPIHSDFPRDRVKNNFTN